MTKKAALVTEEEFHNPQAPRLAGMPADEWIAEQRLKPDPPWLLHEAIAPGGLTIVSGRPKAGKSFLAYLMAMALSSGVRIGPLKPVGRVRCLYLDLEGVAKQTARRLELLCVGHGFTENQLHNMYVLHGEPFELLKPGAAAEVVAAIHVTGVQVLFIDTFGRSFTGEENSKKDVQKYLDIAAEVRQTTGCAVVLVHHTNKAQLQYKDTAIFMDPDGGLRGSSAIAGAYDVIFSMQDGWVEGEHMDVVMSQGKYTSAWWTNYELDGRKAVNPETGEEEFIESWLKFGKRRDELGLFERAPSENQPAFKRRKEEE